MFSNDLQQVIAGDSGINRGNAGKDHSEVVTSFFFAMDELEVVRDTKQGSASCAVLRPTIV